MTDLHTAAKQDLPDLIAGTLGVSRGTAYDLMREALAQERSSDEQPAQREPKTKDVVIDNLGKPFTVKAYVDPQPAQQEPVGCEGAAVNGRVYADRLEHDYKFECEAGPLHMCTDWVEFRRCFEWLAQHTSPPAQRKPLTDEGIQTIAFEAVKDNWDWLRFARAIEAAHGIGEKK